MKCILDLGKQLRLRELNRGNVDRNAEILKSLLLPDTGLTASLLQNPFTDRNNESGLVGNRDKFVRRHESEFRVVPAQQRLGRHDFTGMNIRDGLIVQQQFVAFNRAAQRNLHGHALRRRVEGLAVIVSVGGAGLGLGARHGSLGIGDQSRGVPGVFRAGAHAHAHGQVKFERIMHERPFEAANDRRHQPFYPRLVGDSRHEHRELVTAQTGKQGFGAGAFLQTGCDLAHQFIANGVAETIIQAHEVVDIGKHDSRFQVRLRLELLVHALAEVVPVGQAG